MDTLNLSEKFERMGARLKVRPLVRRRFDVDRRDISINILKDGKGEYFELLTDPARAFRVDVLDVQPRDRHLLLMVKEESVRPEPTEKQKFLCGHDERSWFVAAVPGAKASTVKTAMEALKPAGAVESQARNKVKDSHRNRRKNRGFVRQGEWFFIPSRDMHVDPRFVLKNEPMQRSGGKAHWAEFAYRTGGVTVYVSREHPNGLTGAEYRARYAGEKNPARSSFRLMRRNASVYVKGRISHPDHNMITLRFWHKVEMNTENQSAAMRHVAFLD